MAVRILVVDDEPLLALDVHGILDAAGYEVVGPADSVASAILLIDATPIDAAILDLNLARERSDAIADRLAEMAVPFLFLTGYSAEHLPEAHSDRTILNKPFREEMLLRKVSQLLT